MRTFQRGVALSPHSRISDLSKGFSLIELMVVIGIIAVLTSIGIVSYSQARNRANIAKAQADMETLKKAMILYKLDYGELPPSPNSPTGYWSSDFWNLGSNPPSSAWTIVIDALIQGGYLKTRIDKDPWGNYYGYDDNDCNSNPWKSPLVSPGSDKVTGTVDDYLIYVTDEC